MFRKSYNKGSNKVCFLEFDVQYPRNLHDLHYDLLFLPEIMKIEKGLVANFHDKIEYVIDIGNLKQVLNNG